MSHEPQPASPAGPGEASPAPDAHANAAATATGSPSSLHTPSAQPCAANGPQLAPPEVNSYHTEHGSSERPAAPAPADDAAPEVASTPPDTTPKAHQFPAPGVQQPGRAPAPRRAARVWGLVMALGGVRRL